MKGRKRGGGVLGLYVGMLIVEGVEFCLSGLWGFVVGRSSRM